MSSSSLPSTSHWPAVDARGFGEPFDAFPVDEHFTVKPDLIKLTPPDDWLRIDRQWPEMMAAKLAAMAGGPQAAPADNVMLASACEPARDAARLAAVRRCCEALGKTAAGRSLGIVSRPDGISFGAAGYRVQLTHGRVQLGADRADAESVLGTLASGSDGLRLLGALAMSLQEDLVLMEQAPGDDVARAALFHVSFPSAWNPASKVGQDLLALHAPVADNAPLQAAAARLGQALLGKGPFVRWVWTVTHNPRWRAWPPPDAAEAFTDESPLYFRLERQTTLPLGEGYGMFLIRVQVKRLEHALAQPGRCALLRASLMSMSESMVSYKNLAGVRRRLLAVVSGR